MGRVRVTGAQLSYGSVNDTTAGLGLYTPVVEARGVVVVAVVVVLVVVVAVVGRGCSCSTVVERMVVDVVVVVGGLVVVNSSCRKVVVVIVVGVVVVGRDGIEVLVTVVGVAGGRAVGETEWLR